MLRKSISGLFLLALVQIASGQTTTNEFASRINYLTTAVPFLTIPLNPTLNGVITTVPDGTSAPGIYGNYGLVALDSARFQVTADYVPWIRHILPDKNLFGFGAAYRINQKNSIGINLRYFSLGSITWNTSSRIYRLSEFAGTAFYAYNPDKFTGLGIGLTYIRSDLNGGYYVGGVESHPGVAIAADLGFAKQIPSRNGFADHFIGITLKNLGTKISYTANSDKDFIPLTLKAGYGLRLNLAPHQSLTISYEFAKLLVPTPPVYYPDSVNANEDPVIEAGYDPNVGVFRGMIQSFYDAPGGVQEEFHELTHSFGVVYKYRFLSAGAGYYNQSAMKGNNKFFTFGLSGNINFKSNDTSCCRISVSYILPALKSSALHDTWQLGINLVI